MWRLITKRENCQGYSFLEIYFIDDLCAISICQKIDQIKIHDKNTYPSEEELRKECCFINLESLDSLEHYVSRKIELFNMPFFRTNKNYLLFLF